MNLHFVTLNCFACTCTCHGTAILKDLYGIPNCNHRLKVLIYGLDSDNIIL